MKINIMEILRTQHRGRLLEALERDVADSVAAVRESGKKGEVVLKIKIEPASKDGQQVYLNTTLNPKHPRMPKAPNLYFVTDDGGLSVRDPRQPEMPGEMRVVRGEGNVDRKSAAAGEQ